MTHLSKVLGNPEPNIKNKANFLEALQHPVAWPGGYPTYFITKDGGAICPACGKKEKDLIIEAIESKSDPQWEVIHHEVNYENDGLYCDNCNKQIESAYGDTED